MLLFVVSGAARYIDLADIAQVSASASVLLDPGVGLEFNNAILSCPFTTSVLAVAQPTKRPSLRDGSIFSRFSTSRSALGRQRTLHPNCSGFQ